MDLFARFKKDYFNYLISVILPAVISGLSIPLFKYLLGAKGYGRFSLWLNAALIISAVLYGWIAQSILRFYHEYKDKHTFSKQALFLSVRTQLIFFLPIFFVLYFTTHDLLLAFLFGILVFATSLQFTVMNLVQSSFLSRKIIASEAIRMSSYISIAVILLKFAPLPYLYSLLAAVIIAYFSAMMFLLSRRKIKVSNDPGKHESFAIPDLFKKFFRYGAPLSVWFVFAYLLSYVDKVFMFKYVGAEAQGNYQAIFDLLSRGITLMISPVVTSLFPILTSAFAAGEKFEIRSLMKKIILLELAGFTVFILLYWWFGYRLLFYMLKTPDTFSFKMMGFIVICGTFIWQLSIVVQKKFELQLKSRVLLVMVILAFLGQVCFYLVFMRFNDPLVYPLGYLLSACIYLFLVSFTQFLEVTRRRKMKRGTNEVLKDSKFHN